MTALQLTWFLLVGFFVIGYTVLAGFDLGMSMLALGMRDTRRRKAILAGLGPFWDGNEVWLIGAGALLFAVFPPVYAALFSGFYLLFMLALFGLILRVVSIEFARTAAGSKGLTAWSIAMGLGSALSVFLFGMIVGNVLHGIPLSADGVYIGTQGSLFNAFSVLAGLLNVAMILTHGALYLAWKAEGRTAYKARRVAQASWALYLALAIVMMLVAQVQFPHLTRNFDAIRALWLAPLFTIGTIFFIGVWNDRRQDRRAFITSTLAIVALLGTIVISLFPILVPSLQNPDRSLTIVNSASSTVSLTAMLVITLIGMPFVILYTAWVYRAFGGKITDDAEY